MFLWSQSRFSMIFDVSLQSIRVNLAYGGDEIHIRPKCFLIPESFAKIFWVFSPNMVS